MPTLNSRKSGPRIDDLNIGIVESALESLDDRGSRSLTQRGSENVRLGCKISRECHGESGAA